MTDPLSRTTIVSERLSQLVEAIRKSLRSDSALASSELRENRQKVKVILETSQQKFKVWKETWVKDVPDHARSAEKLWGNEGSSAVQDLLRSVQHQAGKIEVDIAKKDNGTSHLGWRHTLRTSLMKKDRTLAEKKPSLIALAVQLSKLVDELWTYSEIAFDSLHGIYSHQMEPPRREMLLTGSLLARPGSLALYQACIQSKADYSLEVLGENAETRVALQKRSSGSSIKRFGLLYRLFAQDREISNMVKKVTIESISRPSEHHFPETEVVQFDINKSDLADDKSWPPLIPTSRLVFIQLKTAQLPSYFRLPGPPSVLSWENHTESLAQLLDKDQTEVGSEERPLPQETRVRLAFKVVECALYLLGTPWLASLSSKRLRRMKTNEGSPFVLEVQSLSLEDLYFEDPDALSEHSQLFSIGVMLVKIALGDDEKYAPNIEDPDLREKSKILASVERSMGSLYCRATAFCLADRRSAPHFGGPEKYEDPKEAAWKSYLTELLEDYHAQVYSR